jgi:general secretion pathway protein M
MQLTATYQRILAVALLLFTLLGLYWVIARPLLGKYEYYQGQVENLQERLQRYTRMLSTRRELEAQIAQIRQDSSVDSYFLKPQPSTLAATDLQQQMKAVVEENGGQLVSTQLLPAAQEGEFTRVGINVQMTADTPAMQRVLFALETSRPVLFVTNLQIRARAMRPARSQDSASDNSVQLTIQFELLGYLRRSEA